MDYEKAYKEALKKAKSMIDDLRKGEDILAVSNLESMFPELKESEEERTRKQILNYFMSQKVNEPQPVLDSWIAWLEKQGEHNKWKPSKDEMDALYGLAYITNKMDDRKDVAITKLYQDLKREFFEGKSYENMFPSNPVNSDIIVGKQGEKKPKWTDEDEENYRDIIGAIHSVAYQPTEDEEARISWIKSIKQRSEEQQ